MRIPESYELIRREDLTGIHSTGYLVRHKKTGARLALIENGDDNKVFYIGFRTPPTDSTGVAHIIEHTVLCGSEKYPLKDPFVELVKGSLNTFLNAMTYPDKTVYPVASTNDKDFQNLMDVYMDAVLHPNIYDIPEIFLQEGWHYEMEKEDGELTLNGVVYNEMKGAFSNPDDVLSRQVLNSLFPDTTYGFESGGDPKVIPELTREAYLDFHRRYYHPSNSYIYLYGDMDFEERLDYLDKEYLSKYDALEVDSAIRRQEAFKEPAIIHARYSVSEDMDPKGESYLSLNFAVGDTLDEELVAAFDVLDYALISKPGAPLQRALLQKGICKDVFGGNDSGTLQPVFSITAKGTDLDKKDEFLSTVRGVLEEQVKNGIDTKAIDASLNSSEFRFREADFGGYPKGLIYGLDLLDTWLYDDDKPFDTLYTIDVLNKLRKKNGTGWFEELVERYLIHNTPSSLAMVEAVPGLTVQDDEELKKSLAEKKAGFSAEEKREIVKRTEELKEFQSKPTPEEDLAKIPLLSREDLKREIRPLTGKLKQVHGVEVLHSDVETNGIIYLNEVFRNVRLSVHDLPKLGFMLRVLGLVDTERYNYEELSDEINSRLGGLTIVAQPMTNQDGKVELTVQARAKMLPGKEKDAVDLFNQILFHSNFSDAQRVKEILLQEISGQQASFQSSGHMTAATRAMSYFSDRAAMSDALFGITYYEYLKAFEADFDAMLMDFHKKSLEMLLLIFRPENLFVSVTGRDAAFLETAEEIPVIMACLAAGDQKLAQDSLDLLDIKDPAEENPIELLQKLHTLAAPQEGPSKDLYRGKQMNEGLKTPAQIQYVCRAGDLNMVGQKYTGAMRILKVILGYDYFWVNIRVKGGAYGCMSQFKDDGEMYFVTYRDPNLEASLDVFSKTPEYLESFNPDERTMTKYIIGTVSTLDTPLTPSLAGLRDLTAFMRGRSEAELQARRNEVLDATAADIRALADTIRQVLKEGYITVIGNEGKIEEAKDLFSEVRNLL